MSARDEILEGLGDSEWGEGLLNAYAHELAEKIRNSGWLRDYTDDHMDDCNQAADLIDPEASK